MTINMSQYAVLAQNKVHIFRILHYSFLDNVTTVQGNIYHLSSVLNPLPLVFCCAGFTVSNMWVLFKKPSLV